MARPSTTPYLSSASNNPSKGCSVNDLIPLAQSNRLAGVASSSENATQQNLALGMFGADFKRNHYEIEVGILQESANFSATTGLLKSYQELILASMRLLADVQWTLGDSTGGQEHKFSGDRYQINTNNLNLVANTSVWRSAHLSLNTQQLINLSHYYMQISDLAYNQHSHYWLRAEKTANIIAGNLNEHIFGGVERQALAVNDVASTRLQYSDVYVNQVGTQNILPNGVQRPTNAGTALNISQGPYIITSSRTVIIDAPRVMINSGGAPKRGPNVKPIKPMPSLPKTGIIPTQPAVGIEIAEMSATLPSGSTGQDEPNLPSLSNWYNPPTPQ